MDDRENSAKPNEEVPREYFFFRCPDGHENRILAEEEDKYDKLSGGEIIVHCQFCSWESSPFKPSFFQHLAPGDVLLWVYTTRKIEQVASTLNISFDSSSAKKPNFFDPQHIGQSMQSRLSSGKNVLKHTAKITRDEVKGTENVAKTEEIVLPKTQTISSKSLQNIPRLNECRSNLYFPQGIPPLKISATTMMPQILKSVLWLAAASLFAFFALRSCERQGNKVAKAIESAGMKSFLPLREGVGKQNDDLPEIRKQSKLRMQFEQEKKMGEKWRQSCELLQENYQKELRAKKNLEKQLEMISGHRDNLREENQKMRQERERERKEIEKILTQGKKFSQTFQNFVQALGSEFKIDVLDKQERDFLQPSFSKDGKFFIFYDDTAVGRKTVRKTLKAAMLTTQGKMTFQELFRTEPMPIKKREIPFLYDWDGKKNVVLLTRIKGVNTIYHVKIRLYGNIVKVLSTRELVSASYPEILSPPCISPNGKYVAWSHQSKLNLMIEVYRLDTASKKCETPGGGDTSKSVAWSPNSETLFFTTVDRQGICAWQFPGKSTSINFSQQIYGRFMSCSPNGKQLAFFKKSKKGKGKVDMCLWKWKKKENDVKILQRDIMTVETCKPCWSDGGRFLALIHKGSKELVVIQDTITRTLFPVFRNAGHIGWIDWNFSDAIVFTYKEGLYARPYRIRFLSCFSSH